MDRPDRGRELRTCERCGAAMERDLMVVVFLNAGGGTRLGPADVRRARCEIWCDDCCAEHDPLWVMVSGDPDEDRATVEAIWASGYTDRMTFCRAWARLREGWTLDAPVG